MKVLLVEFRRFALVNGGRVLIEAGSPDHLDCALVIERQRAAPEAAGLGTDRA